MGSGSSKSNQPQAKKTAPPKPVANVNKQENNFLEQSYRDNDEKQVLQNDKNSKRRDEDEYNNKKQDKGKDKENKKMKMDEKPKQNMLAFEDDSDMENDIDEVLKMPMAIEYPKPKKKDKKDKKNKEEEPVINYDRKLDRDLFNSNSNGYSRGEDLPETYAQRLQRQQYKLQQDLLIRQKTMHRNSREWDDDCGEDENENFMNKGFDASKFRAANQGTDAKKDLFKTSAPQEELDTPRYLQSDSGMEDFQVSRRPPSPKRDLPSYNQSEIDLMHELERDILGHQSAEVVDMRSRQVEL